MKTHIFKILCFALAACLLLALAGCKDAGAQPPATTEASVPTEPPVSTDPPAPTEPHYVTIRCPDAKLGASIDAIGVELSLDDMPLDFTTSWKQVTEDEQTVDMNPGDTLEANTIYQLHIRYQMDLMHPAKLKGPYDVKGEAIFNKRLDDGNFLIIVRFYFPAKN